LRNVAPKIFEMEKGERSALLLKTYVWFDAFCEAFKVEL
jgi:hypothetical protein